MRVSRESYLTSPGTPIIYKLLVKAIVFTRIFDYMVCSLNLDISKNSLGVHVNIKQD